MRAHPSGHSPAEQDEAAGAPTTRRAGAASRATVGGGDKGGGAGAKCRGRGRHQGGRSIATASGVSFGLRRGENQSEGRP